MSTTKTKKRNANHSNTDADQRLEKFFVEALKDIYWAEKQLTRALPKMERASTSEDLKGAISAHLSQTEEHVTRLEGVFEQLGEKARGKKCEAMEGLIKEGESAIEETEEGSMTRDAAIIMSAQKVEHYEIATYGTLAQLAATMGRHDIAETLGLTLNEERKTDELLTEIAVNGINWKAEQESKEGVTQ